MNKIIYFLMFISILRQDSFANEPILAKLQKVYSNGMQKFSISQYDFVCRAYGVITVSQLYTQAKQGSTCREGIDEFYRQSPRLKYFSASLLKSNQYYHIDFKNKQCILYAQGLTTLSELLLKNGLAVRKTVFKDEEFEYSFYESQIDAKENERAMHKNKIKNKCIAELFEIERREQGVD